MSGKPIVFNRIDNVPHSGVHTDSTTICTHKVGTLPTLWTIYTKNTIQVRKDENQVYHHKDLSFKLTNGWFLSDMVNIKLPQRTAISTIERLVMSLGFQVCIDDKDFMIDIQDPSNDFRTILHHLTALALKDLSVVPCYFNQNKQIKYGEVVFEAYLIAASGSGRIKSTNSSIRWLNEQDTLQLKSKLFTLSDTKKYNVGVYSMKYTPTPFAEDIFENLFTLLKAIDFVQNDIKLQALDFVVEMQTLESIELRDVMLLLNHCIGYNNGFVICPKITDVQYSRVYSIFTSISSDTRKKLGFINHDIGSALQTICLQLVEDSSIYPLHQELMNDKVRFRTKVIEATNKDMMWVKKEFNKIDNLDKMPKKYNSYPILKAYYEEAQELRSEIISTTEPAILQRAKDFAKPKLKKVWAKHQKTPEFVEDGLKESSIFFFIWTQYERQIRESMMSCFDDQKACHQVHDAVYSRQSIQPSMIEAKVFEDTGFKVQVDTDQ